jgi:hypothetical protein
LGGGAIYNSGTLNLANLANSTSGGDWVNSGGTIKPFGPNLVMDGSCSIGGLTGDPMLDHLADNGGPTKTFALLTGSPAINAADTKICAVYPVNNLDQRGQPRSTDGQCDIGAYESAPSFLFTGFLAPVANPPAENSFKAGQGVPIKFSLGGNQGLNIFASGSPFSQPASCSTATTDVTQTVTAGNSSLSYDPASNTYTYDRPELGRLLPAVRHAADRRLVSRGEFSVQIAHVGPAILGRRRLFRRPSYDGNAAHRGRPKGRLLPRRAGPTFSGNLRPTSGPCRPRPPGCSRWSARPG